MYDLFSDLFDGFDWFMQPTTYKEEKKCPVCGRTYSDFRRDGKLGCSECYKVFRGPVHETLRQIHPSTVHVGKIPSKSGEELNLPRTYETLKPELSAAVHTEYYETSATLHHQPRDIGNAVKKS